MKSIERIFLFIIKLILIFGGFVLLVGLSIFFGFLLSTTVADFVPLNDENPYSDEIIIGCMVFSFIFFCALIAIVWRKEKKKDISQPSDLSDIETDLLAGAAGAYMGLQHGTDLTDHNFDDSHSGNWTDADDWQSGEYDSHDGMYGFDSYEENTF
ncbi:MAG: hypothetical protein K5660_04635 [Paludibacteraceae bacterium]|nr:hypothetical protein [Paludibacteraceae bacterium]